MAEFRIKRTDLLKYVPVCPAGLRLFDEVATDQANGSPDVVFPDGWSEVHSILLYQRWPDFHHWLSTRGLIPRDNVPSKFPPPIYKSVFANYPKAP